MRKILSAAVLAAALISGGGLAHAQAQPSRIGRELIEVNYRQYLLNGRQYCWYPSAWEGPGWYWCGYAWNDGLGWGGGRGWNGWRHGGHHGLGGVSGRAGGFGGHPGALRLNAMGGGSHMGAGFGGGGHMGGGFGGDHMGGGFGGGGGGHMGGGFGGGGGHR